MPFTKMKEWDLPDCICCGNECQGVIYSRLCIVLMAAVKLEGKKLTEKKEKKSCALNIKMPKPKCTNIIIAYIVLPIRTS